MSAIALLLDRTGAPGDGDLVRRMLGGEPATKQAPGRGPDGARVVVEGAAAVGHGLFATLPEDAVGALPLRFARERAVIVTSDARIDNRRDLAPLLALGPGAPDAEFIAAAYLAWGEACAERLHGDFAFAVWDPSRQTLYAARDRLGVRPLYVTEGPGFLACASEKRALLVDPRVARDVDEKAVALLLLEEFHERDRTLVRAIRPLEPAHALIVTPEGVRTRRYWRPDPFRRIVRRDDDEYAEEYRALFDEAVRACVRSSTPVAGHFSGGFDSTSIVASAERMHAREGTRRVEPYRLSFPELPNDETGYALAAAEHLGIRARQVYPLEDIEAHRPSLERVSADNLYIVSNLGAELVARTAARETGARVMLTGLGGDQLLRFTATEAMWHLRAGRPGAAAYEVGGYKRLASGLIRRTARRLVPPELAMRRYVSGAAGGFWASLSPQVRHDFLEEHCRAVAALDAIEAPDVVQQALAAPLVDGHNVGWILSLADKMTATTGVEHRHPFFDVRLVEFLLAVPHRLRYDGDLCKGILKLAMRRDLPPVLLHRTDRMLFNEYHARSVFEPFAEPVQRWLLQGELVRRGFLDGGRFSRWFRADRMRRSYQYTAMALALELWLRHFFQ